MSLQEAPKKTTLTPIISTASGQVRKILAPQPEFDPRTVLPVASCYTD